MNNFNFDSKIILYYIIILKNILKLSQNENNSIIITMEENNSLSLLLLFLIKNYFKETNIKYEIILLIEMKSKEEYLIKILVNNGLLNKIIELYNEEVIQRDENKNKGEKENISKICFAGLLLINNLLNYNFCLVEIIKINLNPIAKRIQEYIFDINICETFLLLYIKIKKYLETIDINIEHININYIFSYDVINLIIKIFIKYIDNKSKTLVKNILEILAYFFELPSPYSIFQQNIDNTFIICLFKSIDNYFDKIYIMHYSIKILFRLFSQIKIIKENNIVELKLKNKEDDLQENLFFEESSDISKIFDDDFFLNFTNNNITKIITLYYNENKLSIIKDFIELLRILTILIKSEMNHKNLLDGFINTGEKFINFINKKDIVKKNGFISDIYTFNIIKHFSFLNFQLILINKEIIRKDFISLLISINNIIKLFYMSHEIINRYLNIIYTISIYSDKMEINRRISIIIDIFENIKNHKELFSEEKENNNNNDIQIESLFLFTKILFSLKKFDFDLINNNIYFILLHLPKSKKLSSNKNKIINYNEINYNEFKNNISELCSLYYIKSDEEAMNIINHLTYLLNEYFLFSNTNTNNNFNPDELNSEIIFLLRIIKNLCLKTSLMIDEILKRKNMPSSFMNIIKNYIKKLNIKDNEDNDKNKNVIIDEYDEYLDIINNEKEYIDIEKEKTILENNKKIYLI